MIRTIYTWFLIALLVVIMYFAMMTFFSIQVVHASEKKYLQKNYIDPRKTNIHSADGKEKGYLKQSPIDPRKTVQYDKNGNVEGTWRKSYIDPRKRVYIPRKK
jgi:hypothetical protein